MQTTTTIIGSETKKEVALNELKSGKWYKIRGRKDMLILFKEPSMQAETVGVLKCTQIFMAIRSGETHASLEQDSLKNRKWVYLGVGEQFGYVSFSASTMFDEVTPET